MQFFKILNSIPNWKTTNCMQDRKNTNSQCTFLIKMKRFLLRNLKFWTYSTLLQNNTTSRKLFCKIFLLLLKGFPSYYFWIFFLLKYVNTFFYSTFKNTSLRCRHLTKHPKILWWRQKRCLCYFSIAVSILKTC